MFNSKDTDNIGQFKQLVLWKTVTADPGPAVKAAMCEAIRHNSLSRPQICDEMNRLAAIAGIRSNGRSQKVTVSILDKWCAPGAETYHIPLRLLHIFCRAVANNLPLIALSAFFQDAQVISKEDFKKLRWAEVEIEARKNRKKASRLAQEVGL